MRTSAPFDRWDLDELDQRLLAHADAVVAMEDIAAGNSRAGVIGLRHDVDNVIEPAVRIAEWEAVRGYRATFFVLHTAPYWENKDLLRRSLARIAGLGHEIGFHINALTVALTTGRDPVEVVDDAVGELRGYGHYVHGVVAHGDSLCYQARFVNDELFAEVSRPDWGTPDRVLEHQGVRVPLPRVPRSRFGFDYDPNWLSRADYLSDSGGRWSQPFDDTCDRFGGLDGQLHVLWHPDWWGSAFDVHKVAA